MKLSSLQKKLSKIENVSISTHGNGYNMYLCFSIKGKRFEAGYTEGVDKVDSFSYAYDNGTNELARRWFYKFTDVLEYANK